MGADLRHVKTVIHAGPPQNLEGTVKYSCLLGHNSIKSNNVHGVMHGASNVEET